MDTVEFFFKRNAFFRLNWWAAAWCEGNQKYGYSRIKGARARMKYERTVGFLRRARGRLVSVSFIKYIQSGKKSLQFSHVDFIVFIFLWQVLFFAKFFSFWMFLRKEPMKSCMKFKQVVLGLWGMGRESLLHFHFQLRLIFFFLFGCHLIRRLSQVNLDTTTGLFKRQGSRHLFFPEQHNPQMEKGKRISRNLN